MKNHRVDLARPVTLYVYPYYMYLYTHVHMNDRKRPKGYHIITEYWNYNCEVYKVTYLFTFNSFYVGRVMIIYIFYVVLGFPGIVNMYNRVV